MNGFNLKPASFNSLTKRLLGHFAYGPRPRPQRDWFSIVSLSVLLLLIAAGWSYLLFQNISSATSAPQSASMLVAPTAALDQVQTIFGQRAQMQTRYLTTYHFVDPSK